MCYTCILDQYLHLLKIYIAKKHWSESTFALWAKKPWVKLYSSEFIPGGVFSFPGIREWSFSFPGIPGARE